MVIICLLFQVISFIPFEVTLDSLKSHVMLVLVVHIRKFLSEALANWPFIVGSTHGIKVIIDLHAAPGSQNGQEHSSSRDSVAEWAQQGGATDYLYESIKTIDFLANR